jgi:hypothetical protein
VFDATAELAEPIAIPTPPVCVERTVTGLPKKPGVPVRETVFPLSQWRNARKRLSSAPQVAVTTGQPGDADEEDNVVCSIPVPESPVQPVIRNAIDANPVVAPVVMLTVSPSDPSHVRSHRTARTVDPAITPPVADQPVIDDVGLPSSVTIIQSNSPTCLSVGRLTVKLVPVAVDAEVTGVPAIEAKAI